MPPMDASGTGRLRPWNRPGPCRPALSAAYAGEDGPARGAHVQRGRGSLRRPAPRQFALGDQSNRRAASSSRDRIGLTGVPGISARSRPPGAPSRAPRHGGRSRRRDASCDVAVVGAGPGLGRRRRAPPRRSASASRPGALGVQPRHGVHRLHGRVVLVRFRVTASPAFWAAASDAAARPQLLPRRPQSASMSSENMAPMSRWTGKHSVLVRAGPAAHREQSRPAASVATTHRRMADRRHPLDAGIQKAAAWSEPRRLPPNAGHRGSRRSACRAA